MSRTFSYKERRDLTVRRRSLFSDEGVEDVVCRVRLAYSPVICNDRGRIVEICVRVSAAAQED